MRKQIVQFYDEKGLDIAEMITRAKFKGITPAQMEEALVKLYDEHGHIKDIDLYRTALNMARGMKGERYVITKGIIDELRAKNKRFKLYLKISLITCGITLLVLAILIGGDGTWSLNLYGLPHLP